MTFPLFSNSSTVVNLDPDYSFKEETGKIESKMRTIAGTLIQYKFSDYPVFKVPVQYVNSADRYLINYWWLNNTDLVFQYNGSDFAVRITNDKNPLPSFNKPYDNLWSGEILLEGY